MSGSVTLRFLNSIAAAHALMHSGHKRMQILRGKHQTKLTVLRLTLFQQRHNHQKPIPTIMCWCCHRLIEWFGVASIDLTPLKRFILREYQYKIYKIQKDILKNYTIKSVFYRLSIVSVKNTVIFTELVKPPTFWGKWTSRKPCSLNHNQHTHHQLRSVIITSWLVVQVFTSRTESVKRCARASACQAVKLREAEFSGLKEKLEKVHCETQCTQEFTVSLIKPMKSRTLNQQA